ncbi:tRNA (guanosine(37)-N1)-methyltransferase TrmD [Treponema sp. OMZ 840]|uniref:tRNA (guanosine(37)-N1)-methyltransferase TrmD n=1 Tax=Treponema sp. OMZ 840 TaxID=244313 RepID=UPI003D8BDB47
MKFYVLTLFPEIVHSFFESSIMAKAVQKGIIAYELVNIRDFAFDKHKTCDDTPYGGGAGMLMLPGPLDCALQSVLGTRKAPQAAGGAKKKVRKRKEGEPRVIYVTPSGKPFTQKMAAELSREKKLVFICGRYEGIDQRIIDKWVDDEISVGDFVLSSGEIAAEVVIDAVYRLVDGVISAESLAEESFSGGLLEYPQYTKPEVFDGMKVPEVLLSGNHERIRLWRLKKRVAKTLAVRPDMIWAAREAGLLETETENCVAEITRIQGDCDGCNKND